MDTEIEESKLDRLDIKNAIVELSAQVRDYHHEISFLSRQVDRLKEAIQKIAKETGVKLKVEL